MTTTILNQNNVIEEIKDSLIEILGTIFTSFTEFIPDLFIGLVVLLVGYIIARILRWLIVKSLSKVGFDNKIEDLGLTAGLERVNIKQPPSAILGKLVFYVVILNFLLFSLEKMHLGDAVLPLKQFIDKIPAMIAALITFVLGTIIARFLGNIVSGALSGIGFEFHQTFGSIVRGIVMCVVSIIALQQIGLDVNVLTNLFVSTLMILTAGFSIAFGLGGRTIIRNVLAGFYARDLFKTGERILVDGQEGIVSGIGTINTVIATETGSITIPNTRLTEDTIQRIG